MSVGEKVVDFLFKTWNKIEDRRKTRTLIIELSRSTHYKLQLICDDLNNFTNEEYELTPEVIAGRVIEVFAEQSFEDSVRKIAHRILPEIIK